MAIAIWLVGRQTGRSRIQISMRSANIASLVGWVVSMAWVIVIYDGKSGDAPMDPRIFIPLMNTVLMLALWLPAAAVAWCALAAVSMLRKHNGIT